jgi:hypothetical protein
MSNWIPLARCDRPPMRDLTQNIIWQRLTNLTLAQIADLYRKNNLLVCSRFEEKHRVLLGAPLAEDIRINPINGAAS